MKTSVILITALCLAFGMATLLLLQPDAAEAGAWGFGRAFARYGLGDWVGGTHVEPRSIVRAWFGAAGWTLPAGARVFLPSDWRP